MKHTVSPDVIRLIAVAFCCLAIIWLVRSPTQIATTLYSNNPRPSEPAAQSTLGQKANMGKAEALSEIQAAIAANKVMVYSKSYCPYCDKAKNALNKFLKPNQYAVVELENRPDCDVMQDALLDITGGRSVPRVFINGKFLGGGDDTAAAAANGTLQRLLGEAGLL